MNATEQTLLLLTSVVILAGTLVVFVMQYARMRKRDKDD